MNETVSIIVPARQEEKRIERCLQSILRSSYSKLEVIVVNDGSTDNAGEIVEAFKKRNKKENVSIKLFTIPKSGAAYARNFGLRQAKGEFIGFADADDLIHPLMIEKLVDSLQRGNDLASCGLLNCKEGGQPKHIQHRLRGIQKICPHQAMEMAMWDQIIMSICSTLFRREKIMDKAGKLLVSCPEDMAVYEDFAFICEYISRCSGQMEVIPFRGYLYCKHRGSLTDRAYAVQEIQYALKPILAIGEKLNDSTFIAHKLQYAFRFMAFWYEQAYRYSKEQFSPGVESWEICMQELEKYADVFLLAPNVAFHRKVAMWVIRKHPNAGRWLARIAGGIFWRRYTG